MGLLEKIPFGNKKDKKQPKATAPKASKAKPEAKKQEKKQDKKPVAPKASKAKRVEVADAVKIPADLASVILRPHVTEKAASLATSGTYAFVVADGASRIQIAKAVKALYGVQPTSVRVMNVRGKRVRYGRKYGKRRDWKKALVTLPEGKRIDVYEGV